MFFDFSYFLLGLCILRHYFHVVDGRIKHDVLGGAADFLEIADMTLSSVLNR